MEAISDAVFGLAITLIVVSGDSPKTFEAMAGALRNFAAVGVCFGILFMIWDHHYVYCRRFGLQDATVRGLTALLLFLVTLYAYPLKFVFTLFLSGILHLGNDSPAIKLEQVPTLFTIYGVGWSIVNLSFAALYAHALRRRTALEMSPVEIKMTRLELWMFDAQAGVGLLSVLLANVLPLPYAGMAGFTYFLVGVVAGVFGHLQGEVARAEQEPGALPVSEVSPEEDKVTVSKVAIED